MPTIVPAQPGWLLLKTPFWGAGRGDERSKYKESEKKYTYTAEQARRFEIVPIVAWDIDNYNIAYPCISDAFCDRDHSDPYHFCFVEGAAIIDPAGRVYTGGTGNGSYSDLETYLDFIAEEYERPMRLVA